VIFGGLITFLSIAFLAVVLEFGVARYYSEEESNWNKFHPTRGWALAPGQYWIKPTNQFGGFALRINDSGLRSHTDADVTRRTRTVLVLGDSFTFARETRTEALFTQHLQHLVDKWPGSVRVVNAGVPGYGTAQQLLLTKELIRERHLQPEVCVLVFFTNDILDNLCLSYGNLVHQGVRPCFIVDEEGRLVLNSLPERMTENAGDDTLVTARATRVRFKTVSVARTRAEEWLQTKPNFVRLLGRMGINAQLARMPALVNGWYREDIVSRGVPLTAALVQEISVEVSGIGGQLLVAMVPSPLQVYSETYLPLLRRSFEGNRMIEAFAQDILRPQRHVRHMAEEAVIPFLDLFPLFRANNGETLFIPRDGHLNDAGHKLVADSLYRFIISRVWKAEAVE
jgi:lysophospholipase L1-like esterase